jgi:hypothetical protein
MMNRETILTAARTHAPGELLYVALQGSRLYGAQRPGSDYDFKAIYLPPLIDVLDSRQKDSLTVKGDDYEITLWSFAFWLRLLSNGDTNAIDLYFAHTHPEGIWLNHPLVERLREVCPVTKILPRDLKGMRSFARSQAIKYGAKGDHYQIAKAVLEAADRYGAHVEKPRVAAFWEEYGNTPAAKDLQAQFPEKLRTADAPDGVACLKVLDKLFYLDSPLSLMQTALRGVVDSYGRRAIEAGEKGKGADWKALSHSVRVLDEVIELHTKGRVDFPLKDADLHRRIKLGELEYDAVLRILEQREQQATEAETHSILSEHTDRESLDKMLKEAYGV